MVRIRDLFKAEERASKMLIRWAVTVMAMGFVIAVLAIAFMQPEISACACVRFSACLHTGLMRYWPMSLSPSRKSSCLQLVLSVTKNGVDRRP